MKRWFVIGPLAAVALAFAACGGGDNDNNSSNGGDSEEATASGEPLSDEEYLRVFCTGVTNYRNALNTAPREGLVDVIEEYIDSMRAVTPPEDAQGFHDEFIGYLEEAVEEPTFLVTRDPPRPPDDVRERLASKTSDIDECEYPTFLDGQ